MLSIAEGNAEEKCNKVVALYEALKADGVKYGKYHELVVLASLAMLPVEQSVLVEDIKAADAFLTEQKGYGGFFGLDKKTRLMHAAMIVSCDYVKNDNSDVAANCEYSFEKLANAHAVTICAIDKYSLSPIYNAVSYEL